MKTRKTLFIVFSIFLLLLMLGVAVGLYYYTHPPKVRALMEKVVSRATGAAFSVEQLSYSLDPIRLHARGVVIKPAKGQKGGFAQIQDVTADCVLEGSFGRKTLVFKTLTIQGLTYRTQEGETPASKGSGSDGSSFLSSMAKYFVSFFIFRDIRLEGARLEKGSVVLTLNDNQILVSDLSGRLDADRLVHLQGGVLVTSQTEHGTLSIPDFHLDTTGEISLIDPRINFKIAFWKGALSTPQAEIGQIEGGMSLNYDHSERKIIFAGLDLTLGSAQLPQIGTTPFDITLKADGNVDLKDKKTTVHDLSLNAKKLLQVDGKLNLTFGKKPEFKIFLDRGRIFSRKFMSLGPVAKKTAGLSVSGAIGLSGIFSGEEKEGQWAFFCDMNGDMKKSPLSYRTDTVDFRGIMTGEVAAKGPLSHLDLSGELTGNRMNLQGNGFSLASAKGSVRVSGIYPEFVIEEISCRMPRMEFIRKKKTSSLSSVEIDATKGRVNVLERAVFFPEIRVKSSLLTNILASLQMNGDQLALTVKGKDTGLLRAASTLKLLPSTWTFRGTDTLALTATVNGKDSASFSARLGLEEFRFKNPGETRVGENISLAADISGQIGSNPFTVGTTAEITAGKGEVLMDQFYFDLGENTFSAQFNGDYRGGDNRLKVDKMSLGMKDMPTAHVTGELFGRGDGVEGELSIQIPDTSLKAPFQRLVREPFQTEKPSLSALQVDGMIGAKMTLTGRPSRWVGKGVCTWKDGALFHGDTGYAMKGIQLSLPLWLTHKADEEVGGNLKGMLRVRSMQVPFLPEQEIEMPLEAAQNRLLMPETATLAVPGGTVRMGPSRVTHLMGSAPEFRTALYFESLQLAPLLSEIWPQPVTGRAHGRLDSIRILRGQMQSTGEIKADIFGGTLTLSHVGARGLFTSLPVIHLDAQWHHLNLAKMTQGTSFGKIEGILDGYAKDLEVSNGQLQRFDLLLDTVETDDIPQRISVKAVDNIARLGGGQSPFAGVAGMFVSLFKEFPYKKIGVHATLENDVFRIHGTIQEDGKEYLVKRGFFSGVDVINQSKGNRVGFKDMLKRIKRITDSKGGPVIR